MRQNEMKLEFDSRSCNEAFARVAVASFLTQMNPTLEEVADVKTAVSEAVTNAIIHGYEGRVEKVTIRCRIFGEEFSVEVEDKGRGIPDVRRAMEPMYTTLTESDRAGMGFAFMEAFMDTLEVESSVGVGTTVRMTKRIRRERNGDPAQCRTLQESFPDTGSEPSAGQGNREAFLGTGSEPSAGQEYGGGSAGILPGEQEMESELIGAAEM